MSAQILVQVISGKLDFINLPKISLRKIWVPGFILITLLLMFYIFQISEITQATFFISKYEQEITGLSRQNKDLEANLSQEKSLSNLEIAIRKLNYEKVNKVYYIQILDGQVAAKP